MITDIFNLVLSGLLGALIGYERQCTNHSAGARTFALISLGSCLAMIISTNFYKGDPGRIAAQVVSGIGFLGAGIIMHSDDKVYGLTTAASVWVSAIIGLAVGAQLFEVAIVTTIISLVFLLLEKIKN